MKCIEEEIPFEVPEGWAWARIDTICVINPRNSLNDSLNVSFVPMSLIDEGYVNSHSSDIRKWSEVKAGFTHLAENDIGIAKITPCFENRKSTIFCNLTNGYGAGTTELYVLRVINSTISQKYLIWIVKTDSFIQGGIQSFSGAVGQQRVRKEYISKYLIPVPPRKEQDRIVHKLNELFALVILLEKEKSSLQISIKQVKAKVLDLAIRGKLVPQDPNDESASMLLESIRAEKEELIKQGKIKWDKQESVIFKGEDNSYYEKTDDTVRCIDEEIPFEIPESWIYVRLKHIGQIIGGGTPKTDIDEYWDGEIPWLTPADLSSYEDMYISGGSRTITETGLKSSSARLLPQNSVLYSSRAPIGYVAIASNPIATNQGFKSVIPYESAISPYLYYCLKARTENIVQRATGTTFKEISGLEMAKTIVPLPPINEQRRIYEIITNVFAAISTIEKL